MAAWLVLAATAGASEVAERRAYEAAIAGATAEARLYDGWHTALLARATLLTPAVVSAQAARVGHLTADVGAPPAAAQGIGIVLSATSHWKEVLHLADDGSAPWTVSLLVGDARCSGPAHVVELKKPSELDRTLYPHITDWDRVFKLTWPAEACGGQAPTALRLQGSHGVAELTWKR